MKKRILLLIPCILLALGLLTSCGDNGSQSSGSIENQLTRATWSTSVGSLEDFEGLIDIKLPFELGNLVKINFDSNGKGSISVFENSPLPLSPINFQWDIKSGNQITLTFDSSFGGKPIDLNFTLDGNGLKLTGPDINIKLDRD